MRINSHFYIILQHKYTYKAMREKIYQLLERLHISYIQLQHQPITTMDEGIEIARTLGVNPCKNLFLVNKQRQYFLLLTSGDKKVSLKEIAGQIGSSRLSFASDEDLKDILNCVPGGVSPLGLIYDNAHKVTLIIDSAIINTEYTGCHPCENTISLKLRTKDLLLIVLPAINHPDYITINTNLK